MDRAPAELVPEPLAYSTLGAPDHVLVLLDNRRNGCILLEVVHVGLEVEQADCHAVADCRVLVGCQLGACTGLVQDKLVGGSWAFSSRHASAKRGEQTSQEIVLGTQNSFLALADNMLVVPFPNFCHGVGMAMVRVSELSFSYVLSLALLLLAAYLH